MRNPVRAFVIAAASLLACVAPSAAAGLFAPVTTTQELSTAAQKTPDMAVVRTRDVLLDAAYLAQRVAPAGVDDAAHRVSLAPPAAPVAIEMFPGVAGDFERSSIDTAHDGGFVWTGESRRGTGIAILVIRQGRVTGQVTLDGKTYRIDPLGAVSGAHRISEVDDAAFPGDIERVPDRLPAPSAPLAEAPAAAATDITVLVAYTQRVRDSVADVVAQANLAVALANTAFQRSQVDIVFRLVGTQLVGGYDERAAASYNAILDSLTNGSGAFAPTHALRNSAGADLVSLLVDHDQYCGLAWAVENPAPQSAAYGMSVVTASCVTNHTFAHELGHNMGLFHDRFSEGSAAPPSQYNFGYVNVPARFRDIMAYADQCVSQSVNCPRINNFSNPRVSHNGYATGIPQGTAGAADGARKLNETRTAVANYRQSPTPPPTARLVAAITPVARRGVTGDTVTTFATIISPADSAVTATGCTIARPIDSNPYSLAYAERLLPGSGLGPTNATFSLAPGQARHFLLAFATTGQMASNLELIFYCANAAPAPITLGLNSFNLVVTDALGADVLATAVTATNDGILRVPAQTGGGNAAAMAGLNIGASATLTARASTVAIGAATAPLPVALFLCRTDPTTGACVQPSAPTADPISFTANANALFTFAAFVSYQGSALPLDPATRRVFIHFDQNGLSVGSASVAATTTAADEAVRAAARD